MSSSHRLSATSRVFVALLVAVIGASVVVTVLLVWDRRTAGYEQAESVTRALAIVLADSEPVQLGLLDPAGPAGASVLQQQMAGVSAQTGVSYITVMDATGIRFTHPNTAQVGGHYRGTIPAAATVSSEVWEGTLGRSVRTIAPVLPSGGGGTPIGWVSVGVTLDSIWFELLKELPAVALLVNLFAALGVIGALVGRRATQRVAGDLSAAALRDAASSYASLRTLGEALRAQRHEHGNRMHTVMTLLELGRAEQAMELLAETSRESQQLVDLVTHSESVDPTVSALLLGKTAQASERGVLLETSIAPGLPRTTLSATDLVSVLGNLLDNAVDAAAQGGAQPRAVRVRLYRSDAAQLVLEVSDSGDGVTQADRAHLFEWGFSTKPQRDQPRGVGLALVRQIVLRAGGQIEVRENPTTFVVVLPARAGRRKAAE